MLHGNVSTNYLKTKEGDDAAITWGFGTQIHVYKGMHVVGEVFSGDPYVAGAGTAYQAGVRHFISDMVQVGMTIGKGWGGSSPLPFWCSAGVRLVSSKFRKKYGNILMLVYKVILMQKRDHRTGNDLFLCLSVQLTAPRSSTTVGAHVAGAVA